MQAHLEVQSYLPGLPDEEEKARQGQRALNMANYHGRSSGEEVRHIYSSSPVSTTGLTHLQ